jgi:DNA-binding IclR family transcriptional regulator
MNLHPNTEIMSLGNIKLGDTPSPGADRTLAIIELLLVNIDGMTIKALVDETGVAQNTASRIVQTLEMRDFVRKCVETKKYFITDKLFNMSSPRVGGKSLVVTAYDYMQELQESTGETVQILIKSNWKAVVLDQILGSHAVTVLGKVGLRVPLYSCAPGKAILARLSDDQLEVFFKENKLKQFTEFTLGTREKLMVEILEARETGYSVDREEGMQGIQCVAAPILDKRGKPFAAITVIGPKFRLTEDKFAELGKKCVQIAKSIENKL